VGLSLLLPVSHPWALITKGRRRAAFSLVRLGGSLVTKQLLTVPEVSSLLRLHRSTIYRKIAAGILPAVQTGQPHTAVRIDEHELEAWLYGKDDHAE
jgi:excisionase family DNA binding protein